MTEKLQQGLARAVVILAITVGVGSCNYLSTVGEARLIEAKAARTTAEAAAKRSATDVR